MWIWKNCGYVDPSNKKKHMIVTLRMQKFNRFYKKKIIKFIQVE